MKRNQPSGSSQQEAGQIVPFDANAHHALYETPAPRSVEEPTRKRKKKGEQAGLSVDGLWERWDPDMLMSINQLVLDPINEAVVAKIAKEMMMNPTSRRRVQYAPSDSDYEDGRVYGSGLQSVSGWIRRLCSFKYYHDLDIENCGPTLLCQVLERYDMCPRIIKEYASNRDEVFKRARGQVPELRDTPDKALKNIFLRCLHGGRHTSHFHSIGLSPDHDPIALLVEWEEEVSKAMKTLMNHDDYKQIANQINMMEGKTNKVGTFTSWVWQQPENRIIQELGEYLRDTEGLTPGVLVFDGIMVERQPEVPHPATLDEAVLRRAEAFIEKKLSFVIRLIEKPLTPQEKDWDQYWGERALQKIKTDEAKQLYLLAREGQVEGFKRQDDYVMKPHTTIPGVFHRAEKDSDFINRVLTPYHLFRGASVQRLQLWFSSVDHPKFELLTPTKINATAISFLNGYLDLNSLIFSLWEEEGVVPPLTNHYFEKTVELSTAMDAPTPLWDTLVETQLGKLSKCCECGKVAVFSNGGNLYCRDCKEDGVTDGEPPPLSVCDMLEVLIGRLFYPIGQHDNWQVMPFIKGDANTGKSTVADIVKYMFPPGSVGVISANQEEKFGLEPLSNKRAVMIPDLPKKFSKVLDQTLFQSMVTGEVVSVARKNKTAVNDAKWKVPMLAAGNHFFDYKDNSGSISRRVVLFLFTELITTRNTTLKKEIIQSELPTIMLRCIVRYRLTCERYGSADFWNIIVPAALKKAQAEVKESTNHLANFLANGDDYYQILHEEGHLTPLVDLEKAYSNHMRIVHKEEKAKIGDDKHPIKAAGYTIQRLHVCKTCHQKASKETCGEHYKSDNRYRKFFVQDMRIAKRIAIHTNPDLQLPRTHLASPFSGAPTTTSSPGRRPALPLFTLLPAKSL